MVKWKSVFCKKQLANKSLLASVIVAIVFSMGAIAQGPPSGYIEKTVKSGETISLMCIDLYGRYTNAMGNAIQKANPTLSNINKIVPGQVLLFRLPYSKSAVVTTPLEPSQAASKPVPPADTLFEKKIHVTQGVVTYLTGDAVRIDKTGKRSVLSVNAIVYPGEIIETLKTGRIEIIINRETVVRIKENTRTKLLAFRDNGADKGATRVGFSAGCVWTKMKKFADKITRFQLELPNAVAGVHGTVYEATINADSSSDVSVYEGEVAVQNAPSAENGAIEVSAPTEVAGPHDVSLDEWVYIIKSMQKISIGKNGVAATPVSFVKKDADSWVAFNEERDRQLATMLDGKE